MRTEQPSASPVMAAQVASAAAPPSGLGSPPELKPSGGPEEPGEVAADSGPESGPDEEEASPPGGGEPAAPESNGPTSPPEPISLVVMVRPTESPQNLTTRHTLPIQAGPTRPTLALSPTLEAPSAS